MRFPVVSLGDVARPMERPLVVTPGTTYRTIGVKWWGEGAYERATIDGSGTAARTLYLVREGDLIINKIWVRHGSTAIATKVVDECAASNEFPTFELDASRVLPRWMHWLTKTSAFWDECAALSRGTSGKNRIKPGLFLTINVPLPPIDEQRRIVARIDELAAKIEEARELRQQAQQEVQSLLQAAREQAFTAEGSSTVRDFATLQSGYAFKSEWFSDIGIPLVRNVNIGHGCIEWDQIARIPEPRRSEFSRFDLHEGDILISLDRPIISTGVKVARVAVHDLPSLLLQRVGRVQFSNGAVLPDYFFEWLQSPNFTSAIDPGRSNGVPHISPKDVESIAFSPPSIAEQRHIVGYLGHLQGRVTAIKQLQAETATELNALLPSVLDQAFRGAL